MQKKQVNEYGDVIDPNDPIIKYYQKRIQLGWRLQGDPYQDKDMEQILIDYVKFFKQKSDKEFQQKQKTKNFFKKILSLFQINNDKDNKVK